jgi:uracil-DNA glycosylase
LVKPPFLSNNFSIAEMRASDVPGAENSISAPVAQVTNYTCACGFPKSFAVARGILDDSPQMTQPALDLVIATLEKIREKNGRAPRASRTALQRLQNAAVVSSVVPEADTSFTAQQAQAAQNKANLLAAVRERVAGCTKCAHLACSRTQTVFGIGNPEADLMFIGEAPGADEDQQGEPFVGRAGQLLTRIVKAMNFAREDVYIANILKCRPDMPAGSSGNRAPTPVEMQTCRPYLLEQIDIIQPSVLVALGAVAVEGLLGTRAAMRELRGRWHTYNNIPLMITYHPAYLLRNQAPSEKRKVWEDMLQVMERLELPISERQRNYFL